MITYITALYKEAKDLITTLKLKQNHTETLYQLFEGNEICLIITGTGMISAATAVSRHFTKFPSKNRHDLVINIGTAGYTPAATAPVSSWPSIGDLFLVSKITELCTGRTFYPDLLYRSPFCRLPLITAPVIVDHAANFSDETLIDMEASALYQALLPHISPERMLFFKVISDIPETNPAALPTYSAASVSIENLLKPHSTTLISFVDNLHHFLQEQETTPASNSVTTDLLLKTVSERLPMTDAMSKELERLLTYARLSGCPLESCLKQFLLQLPEHDIRGKKQAMPYLNLLRELILNSTAANDTALSASGYGQPPKASSATPAEKDTTFYQAPFSIVYAEKELWSEEWGKKLNTTPIFIEHYKDIFNRSHQNFVAQKKAPSLILAKKTGTLIYKGAPVCQNFGHEYFYYTSCMMNCIYHCDYCYLQGMYPSGHIVVFVNLEDYFTELETLLKQHPVYLCVSYDTDLLALETLFSFVSRWLAFAVKHPELTLEIRTKSGNPAVFSRLSSIFDGKESLKKQIIFAWTVSPENLCQSIEHGAASLSLRLKALLAAKSAGFSVRLCFDPMIFHADWENSYKKLIHTVFSSVPASDLYDVSIGVFRISTEYLKTMRKKRPDCAIVQYPYITENGVSHYGTLSKKMVDYVYELLLPYIPAEKIFLWNGGI